MRPTRYVRLTKTKFTPSDTCYQAVRILDTAAEIAINTGNTELMFQVADKFVDLASRLSPGEEEEYNEEEEESEAEEPPARFGFHHSS